MYYTDGEDDSDPYQEYSVNAAEDIIPGKIQRKEHLLISLVFWVGEDSSLRNDMCVQTGAQKAIAPSSPPPTKWLQSPIGFLLTAAALSQNGRIAV